MDLRYMCTYEGCNNPATGRCEGSQSCYWTFDEKSQPFVNDCEQYFCQDHLKWGWGCFCINGCIASPQCPQHHTGISCTIL